MAVRAVILWVFLMITVKINVVLALDIRNVSLHIDASSIYLTSGTVSLNYRGTSGTYICHYGDQKNWGKREADTACKQLHYDGGWPYDVPMGDSSPSQKLNNFDCDETVSDLNDCEYYVTTKCKDTKLAGVQCYDLFAVQLVGGMSSNMGRVEVKYNDQWASVCYESSDDSSQDWSFANAQVVCRELGFPGTMLAKQGGLGYGDRDYVINGYQCREDLREQSLKSCYPDAPQEVLHESNSSCGFGQAGRSNDAVAICAVPGYIGCFNNEDVPNSELEKLSLQNMTINTCRTHCRELIYRYALLQQGDTCHCAGVFPATPLGDTMCTVECSGDDNQVCGDETTSSVYDVAYGTCVDPLGRGNRMFYFGDIFDAFECGDGMELVNATAIQCIMTSSMDGFTWNDTRTPLCKGIGKDDEIGLGIISIIVIALGVLIACLIVVLVFLLVRCLYLDNKQKRYYVEIQDLESQLAEQHRKIQEYEEQSGNHDEQMQDEKQPLFQSAKKWVKEKLNINDRSGETSDAQTTPKPHVDTENIVMTDVSKSPNAAGDSSRASSSGKAGKRKADTHGGTHKGAPSAAQNTHGPSTSRTSPMISGSSTDSRQGKPKDGKRGKQTGNEIAETQDDEETNIIEDDKDSVGEKDRKVRDTSPDSESPPGKKTKPGGILSKLIPDKEIGDEPQDKDRPDDIDLRENSRGSAHLTDQHQTGDGRISPSKSKSFKKRKPKRKEDEHKNTEEEADDGLDEISEQWVVIGDKVLDDTEFKTSSPDSAGTTEDKKLKSPDAKKDDDNENSGFKVSRLFSSSKKSHRENDDYDAQNMVKESHVNPLEYAEQTSLLKENLTPSSKADDKEAEIESKDKEDDKTDSNAPEEKRSWLRRKFSSQKSETGDQTEKDLGDIESSETDIASEVSLESPKEHSPSGNKGSDSREGQRKENTGVFEFLSM